MRTLGTRELESLLGLFEDAAQSLELVLAEPEVLPLPLGLLLRGRHLLLGVQAYHNGGQRDDEVGGDP